MWVAEMRSYMPTSYGEGEDTPDGRITMLEDTNGDGRMDKATRFMEGLVLPRAIGLFKDGVLVGAPPQLLFARDTTGDGKADEITVLRDDYIGPAANPEHQANGLLWNIDNWLYNADYEQRLRHLDSGRWASDPVPMMGQWGITQDDWGRLYFNTNSHPLRGSVFPPHYMNRNRHYTPVGANVQLTNDLHVFPAHPAIANRGYLENILRPDGYLNRFTGACAPWVYRGGAFPDDADGDIFVCEPVANFVRRFDITETDAVTSGMNAHPNDEFLTSTYERFRPVNLYTGPEGALYVVDMHHGLIQHKQFLTDYARQLYYARELHKHLRTGRIYRVVHESAEPVKRPNLAEAKLSELLDYLSHDNAWWRETAQRILVERQEGRAMAPLQKLARSGESPQARVHALWTLQGLGRITSALLIEVMDDPHPKVRAAAIRLSEGLLAGKPRPELVQRVLGMIEDDSADVALQLSLTAAMLGEPEAEDVLIRLLNEWTSHRYIRDAVISGIGGRELEFLQRLLAESAWSRDATGRREVLAALAQCVFTEARPQRVQSLLDLTAAQTGQNGWRQLALLRGMAEVTKNKRAKPLMLPEEPAALATIERPMTQPMQEAYDAAASLLVWPGKPGYVPPPPVEPLTPFQQELYEKGQVVYIATCAQCHHADGIGIEGQGPPLAGSEWSVGPDGRLVRIILQGLRGPITVSGQAYNLDMPAIPAMTDEQIAAALTYIRRSWGHEAPAVEPSRVTEIREQTMDRVEPWTERELLRIDGEQ
jgi:mono/diheme cytochrome c family protein